MNELNLYFGTYDFSDTDKLHQTFQTLTSYNITIDAIDEDIDKGTTSIIPITYPSFKDYDQITRSKAVYNHMIETSRTAWHMFANGQVIDLTEMFLNELNYVANEIDLNITETSDELTQFVVAYTVANVSNAF